MLSQMNVANESKGLLKVWLERFSKLLGKVEVLTQTYSQKVGHHEFVRITMKEKKKKMKALL